MLRSASLCALISLIFLPFNPALAQSAGFDKKFDRAIELSRSGDINSAIKLLQELIALQPEDHRIRNDLSVLLARTGSIEQAKGLLAETDLLSLPEYVLDELSLHARNQQQFQFSRKLLIAWFTQNPNSFAASERFVYVLSDLGHADDSLSQADILTDNWPQRYEAWMAKGYASELAGQFVDAITAYQQAEFLAPSVKAPMVRRIISLSKGGSRTLAARLMRENREQFTAEEIRNIESAETASWIRWTTTEPDRFYYRKSSDIALSRVERDVKSFAQQGPAAQWNYYNSLFDQMIALRDAKKMQQVLAIRDQLLEAEVTIPDYAHRAIADAFLYLRQPDKALGLYQKLRGDSLDDRELIIAELSALIESERMSEAEELVRSWVNNEPAWKPLQGSAVPVPNEHRLSAEYWQQLLYYFEDQLATAQESTETMVAKAPNNSSLRQLLATIYAARGWHRRAQEEYELALALSPNNIGLETDQLSSLLDNRQVGDFGSKLNRLLEYEPENRNIQRLQKRWQVHESYHWSLGGTYRSASGDTFGSRSHDLNALLEGKPFKDHWRFQAEWDESFASFIEGDETLHRLQFGLNYRSSRWHGNIQAEQVKSTIDDTAWSAALGWTPADHWRYKLIYQDFSHNTPLRAVHHNIRAKGTTIEGGFRWHESLDWRWQIQHLDFSDGNQRIESHSGFNWRMYAKHRWIIDTDIAVYGSKNDSIPTPYFNPESSYSLPLTLTPRFMLYRNYDTSWWHTLRLEYSPAYQKTYGEHTNWSVDYSQQWQWSKRWYLDYGLGYASSVYDGTRETQSQAFLRLSGTF